MKQTRALARIAAAILGLFLVSCLLPTRHTNSADPWHPSAQEDAAEDGPPTEGIPTATPFDVSDSVPSTSSAMESSVTLDPELPSIPRDKIVVMGRLQKENTDWVAEFLPDWQNAIYTVDNTSHKLHTPRNKGREANAYLTYIIQNYDNLPSTIAFIHPHRDGYPEGWHTDATDNDNVKSLQALDIAFVQEHGYANLRCIGDPGCPDEIQPFRRPPKIDGDGRSTEDRFAEAWPNLFVGVDLPEVVATPCCAQFAVSRGQVLKRPLSDYERYHQWLMDTELSDDISGRIFEYLWHIIFERDPVHCPELVHCYQGVYGGNYMPVDS